MSKQIILENITLGKLVHGGQCLAYVNENAFLRESDLVRSRESQTNRILNTKKSDSQDFKPDMASKQAEFAEAQQSRPADRKVIFVWGGLPGELVDVRVTKKKSSYLEGVVETLHKSSKDRVEPKEPEVYLSSSPWQIMTYDVENQAKQAILEETYAREHVSNIVWEAFFAPKDNYHYRNKVEFGFWGNDNGIHYASYIRGTHGKRIIASNALASEAINAVMGNFLVIINDFARLNNLRAGDLKTVVFRSSEAGEVVAALFIKKNEVKLKSVNLPNGVKGMAIYYSNPKSPASIITEELYIIGDITLTDTILDKNITYDVNSFFQVNVPIFNKAMEAIASHAAGYKIVDFYSGVGTIGVPLKATKLVESDEENIKMARKNSEADTEVIHATGESATDYISNEEIVIVDPPRAGLHTAVVERLLEVSPPKLIYLSCNPSTQARDVRLLQEQYNISYAQGFNFFPRTPHIESLVVLSRKNR